MKPKTFSKDDRINDGNNKILSWVKKGTQKELFLHFEEKLQSHQQAQGKNHSQ